MITIATQKDIPRLCELLNGLFSQEAEFAPDEMLQTRGLQSIITSEDKGVVLIYKAEGMIVGMVVLLFTVSTALGGKVAVLEDMIVDEAFQGKGYGSELIEGAINEAKKRGCLRITLLTDGDNMKAQSFYQKHGFKRSDMVAMRHF